VFFDERLTHRGDIALLDRLEPLGRRAVTKFDQPDAGLWEFRSTMRVHTFSSVMCWAACDRLSRIAARLSLPDRARRWRVEADRIRDFVLTRCFNRDLGTFVSSAGGVELDASLLLLAQFDFVHAHDPRYVATVEAIQRVLMRNGFVFRYTEKDDFGVPSNAFFVCTFWLVDALAAIGRRHEARELFTHLLGCRNPHGLLAEHIDPGTGELWGNFVQTYSMVGLINSAVKISLVGVEAY
jgi:GH15 family glucan-1,4-alpha-glucosidase